MGARKIVIRITRLLKHIAAIMKSLKFVYLILGLLLASGIYVHERDTQALSARIDAIADVKPVKIPPQRTERVIIRVPPEEAKRIMQMHLDEAH